MSLSSISSSSFNMLSQSSNLHACMQGNQLSIHWQLPALQDCTHLQDIRETTMSGSGWPVIHLIYICPSPSVHPVTSGTLGEFWRLRLHMAAWQFACNWPDDISPFLEWNISYLKCVTSLFAFDILKIHQLGATICQRNNPWLGEGANILV